MVYACLCQTRIKLPQKIKTLADFINSRDCPPKSDDWVYEKGCPMNSTLGCAYHGLLILEKNRCFSYGAAAAPAGTRKAEALQLADALRKPETWRRGERTFLPSASNNP